MSYVRPRRWLPWVGLFAAPLAAALLQNGGGLLVPLSCARRSGWPVLWLAMGGLLVVLAGGCLMAQHAPDAAPRRRLRRPAEHGSVGIVAPGGAGDCGPGPGVQRLRALTVAFGFIRNTLSLQAFGR